MGLAGGRQGGGEADARCLRPLLFCPRSRRGLPPTFSAKFYDQVLYIPLGQWRRVAAWRKSLSGVLDGPATPVFWNIDKSE